MATHLQTSSVKYYHSHKPYKTQQESNPNRLVPHRSESRADTISTKPWQGMTNTYTWVLEQQNRQNQKTERWVLEQTIFSGRDIGRHSDEKSYIEEIRQYQYETKADQWIRQEALDFKRAYIEQTQARIVREELRKVEEKIRQKHELENKRKAADRRIISAQKRESLERKEQAKRSNMAEAWTKYENQWSTMAVPPETVTFSSIPWPLRTQPRKVEDITPTAITSFLLSSYHSQNHTRKERIRRAQLRWHPDRFRRLMNNVSKEDKAVVEEGVGIVARCLNELMAQEKNILPTCE